MSHNFVPLPDDLTDKLAYWKRRGERYINGLVGDKWTDAAAAFFRHEFDDSTDVMFPERGDWQFVGSYEDRRGRQCRGRGEHLVWQFTERGEGRWDVRLVGTVA